MRSKLLGLLLILLAPQAFGAPPASTVLPPDNWAVKAADRAEQLGLVERYMPAEGSVPVLVVAKALAEAADRAQRTRPDLAPLVTAWRNRFVEEWPGTATESAGGARILGGDVTLGYEGGSAHEIAAGPPAEGPSALALSAPASDPYARLRAAAALGEYVAIGGEVMGTPSRVDSRNFELAGALGSWELSVGRAPVKYGFNEVGEVVLSGSAPLDRVELMTTAPLQFPGALSALGLFTVDMLIGRIDRTYNPLLAGLSLQWRPHPRFTLALQRGYMFAGPYYSKLTALQMLEDVIYRYDSGSGPDLGGTSVYSATMRLRLPTESFLPLTLTADWGSNDNPGAAVTFPGLIAGARSAMLPGLPVELGFEWAYFGPGLLSDRHHRFAWYQLDATYDPSAANYDGWATGQTPLGDPLGGNGRAYRVVVTADALDARLHVTAMGWRQNRSFDNLYAPMWSGQSTGGSGEAEYRFGRGEVFVRGLYEHGDDGWTRKQIATGAKVFF